MTKVLPISVLVLASSSLLQFTNGQHPDGFRTNLDKGCWGIPAGRYDNKDEIRLADGETGFSVPKCTPQIPRNMCGNCPLDIANVDPDTGNFVNCGRMFKIDSPECQASVQQLITDTPCDTVLPKAYDTYFNNANASEMEIDLAGQTIDRYVYTFCEQCCDCIPCGSTEQSFDDKEKRLDVNRYNCPLHFVFDVCGIYPDITYYGNVPFTYAATASAEGRSLLFAEGIFGRLFGSDDEAPSPAPLVAQTPAPAPMPAAGPSPAGSEGTDEYAPPCDGECDVLYLETAAFTDQGYDTKGALVDGVLMCPLHKRWQRAANQNDTAKLAEIEAVLNPILDYYMSAWGCGYEEAWQPCREMERRMGRMEIGHPNC